MTTQPLAPTAAEIKERQQRTWSAGEYARIGNRLVLMGELLCEAADLRAGQSVLDVATGSGNAAISAARRGCRVTGIDFVPELLQEARARAEAEHLPVDFEVGDAESLAHRDDSFDTVLSTLGAMFVPSQEKTAAELLRVCKPGGKIGLANWTPDGFIGQMFRTVGARVPPPPGLTPPVLWGTEERVRELLGPGTSSLETTRRTFVMRYPSVAYFVDYFRAYYGPVRKAFDALDAAGQEGLAKDLETLLRDRNTSGDGTLVVPSGYLEVVATVG